MKSKLEQVNQAVKKALGTAVYKQIPDIENFSIVDVLIDPSYEHGRVWVTTTPEGLELLNQKRVDIQNSISRYVKLRYTPKLTFIMDDRYLDHMDDLFSKVGK